MAKEKPLVKLNKKTGNKEFKNYFHFAGQVKPVRKQNDKKEWYDAPYFETTTTKTKKPRRVLSFNLETSLSNDLKFELNGMEMEFVYPYSSASGKSEIVKWADRFDKTKFTDNTYNVLGGTDWDNSEEFSKIIETGKWVEIKGHYEFSKYTPENGSPMIIVKRMIKEVSLVEEGQEVKIDKDTKFNYICDFKSPDFKEVNYFNLQIGIRSAVQNEETGNTTVNAVVLSYGKEKSLVEDAELIVYQTVVEEGKKSLASAFATLQETDFIEVIGCDNNRATFSYVDVVETYEVDDPFADVPVTGSTTRQEKVVTGERKGLEIVSFVQKTKILEYLTKEEMTNSSSTSGDNPFDIDNAGDGNIDDLPFNDDDPFA